MVSVKITFLCFWDVVVALSCTTDCTSRIIYSFTNCRPFEILYVVTVLWRVMKQTASANVCNIIEYDQFQCYQSIPLTPGVKCNHGMTDVWGPSRVSSGKLFEPHQNAVVKQRCLVEQGCLRIPFPQCPFAAYQLNTMTVWLIMKQHWIMMSSSDVLKGQLKIGFPKQDSC